ncbi:SusC/RagA family TonB-linked outer membrane protein, partial [Alistipes sp. OttesenSCG-928-B03]|nr:SusC/RagA family TonB-linked outer membrane protein [Alistipes sp. OttesenSCG-928-B03]
MFLFCLLCIALFAPDVHAQTQQTVTLSMKGATVEQVINRLKESTRYEFFYRVGDLTSTPVRDYNFRQAAIGDVMNELVAGTALQWAIRNGVITISMRQGAAAEGGVRGRVVDSSGAPLAGAAVILAGTTRGVTTDAEGMFQLDRIDQQRVRLRVSYLGMVTRELTVNSGSYTVVELESAATGLDEVIVTGYQTISRERATGSFGTITAAKLGDQLQSDLKYALEGQVAGLTIDKDGRIEIRGVSTFSADRTPLIVVDGFPVDATLYDNDYFKFSDGIFENINTNNVASITVLKDGVAASIYGSRAANGVVVITTKKGAGETRVTYKGSFGAITKPDLSNLNLAGASEYIDGELALWNEMWYPDPLYSSRIGEAAYYHGLAQYGMMDADEAAAKIDALRNNDFLKQVEEHLYRTKLTQQHNISINGGTNKHSYNIAANYVGTRENFAHSNSDRLIVDMTNDWNFTKWLNFSANVNLSYNTSESPTLNPEYGGYESGSLFDWQGSLYMGNVSFMPYSSFVDANGKPTDMWVVAPSVAETYDMYDGMKPYNYNLLDNLSKEMNKASDFQSRITAWLRVRPAEGLTLELGGNWQRGSYIRKQTCDEDSFTTRIGYNNSTSLSNPGKHYFPEGGMINEWRNTNQSWTLRAQANYNRDFCDGRHRVNLLLGGEVRRQTTDNNRVNTRVGYNKTAGIFETIDMLRWTNRSDRSDMLYGYEVPTLSNGSYYYIDNRFVSWYGNGSYEFDDRYIVSGSIRLDLTNFFGTDKKYRYKPLWSVGGTWKISEEDFFNSNLVQRLHLRASYGVNGNISLDHGPFLILGNESKRGEVTQATGATIISPANTELRWEKTMSTNVGLDVTALNNRLNLSVDYYYRNSVDLLAPDAIDETTGYYNFTRNVGRITNNGVEVTLSAMAVRNRNFSWNITAVMAHNKNEVKKYDVARPYPTSYASAYPVNVSGYAADGLWGPRF